MEASSWQRSHWKWPHIWLGPGVCSHRLSRLHLSVHFTPSGLCFKQTIQEPEEFGFSSFSLSMIFFFPHGPKDIEIERSGMLAVKPLPTPLCSSRLLEGESGKSALHPQGGDGKHRLRSETQRGHLLADCQVGHLLSISSLLSPDKQIIYKLFRNAHFFVNY